MTVPAKRKFDPARMFNPESVSLSGTAGAYGQQILASLRGGSFQGGIGTDDDELDNADLALVADPPEHVEAALHRHARMGARAAIVLSHQVQGLGAMARAANLRVLGPNSFGLMLPGAGLNATPFGLMPPRGRMALVGQSSSLARTVIDWAVPNAVGFSHLLGIGGNEDMGFGLVLDHFSRDPNTAAIMIEIDRLRDPRSFFSAARAAARLRPVVAIAPGVYDAHRRHHSRRHRGRLRPRRRAAHQLHQRIPRRRRDADARQTGPRRVPRHRHQLHRHRPAGGR